MKKILLATVFLFVTIIQVNAQHLDYENTSKYFWGVNIGHTWHTTDVRNINVKDRFPLGASLIVGRSFNQDYGKTISFDVRGRLLYGRWYGQDRDTTSILPPYEPYKGLSDSLGYGIKNFRASQLSLDLELSMHLNSLKERTGWDPYIFAGIGIVGTNSKAEMTADKDLSVKDYKYETPLTANVVDGLDESYKKEGLKGNILPSLGVGIGYYFNSRFSLGLEHRTTFFRSDYLDGTTVNNLGAESKIKNDLYHYTSIYFKWYFKLKKDRQPPVTPDVVDPVVTDNPTVRTPPVVRFTNPNVSGTTVNNPNYTIRANIQNVYNSNDLTFLQNGRRITSFYYNPSNRTFESAVVLQLGSNTFKLTGTNNDGTSTDQTVVIYKEDERAYPPIVNIVDPASSPHTVSQLSYIVKASIQNIQNKNQLKVTFNDKSFTAFSFTPTGNINFSANLNLTAGVNVLKIVGTNSAGVDSDQTVLIYNRQPAENAYPPTVNIVIPSISPYSTTNPVENVVATVTNVNNKNQIGVKVNGVNTTNFTYNDNNKTVQFSAHLLEGNNVVSVNAANNYGSATDDANIIYRAKVENYPPAVTITTPNVNPYNSSLPTANVTAFVQNIDNKNQIEVRVNGSLTTNFTFNSSTKLVQFTTNLLEGNNNVRIQVANNYGSASDERQLIYKRAVKTPPTVTITKPILNPYTTSNTSEVVTAYVTNITAKSQIEVRVNGAATSNFTFNSGTKTVQLTANLTGGNNVVRVTATNNDGTAFAETNITMRKPVQNPPTVTITKPILNPYTTSNTSEVVTAIVTNITAKSQIEVRVNGAATSNFAFNSGTKTVQLTANLSAGNNVVRVTATNNDGTAFAETNITMRKPVQSPPTVTITKPILNPYTTSNTSEVVTAIVTNITAKSQIEVRVNGAATSNFAFNSGTKTVQLTANLTAGNNVVRVTATNNDGTAFAETNITMRKPVQSPPTVTITKPILNPYTTSNTSEVVTAIVTNITAKSQIEVRVNGAATSNFAFNSGTSTVQLTTNLTAGTNVVRVTATNNDGAAFAETNITMRKPVQNPPTVTITKPILNPYTTSNASEAVTAIVTNITAKSQIEVRVNGAATSNFTFNSGTSTVQLTTNLTAGTNVVRVTATNNDGTAFAETNITYRKPVQNPPIVKITKPATTGMTTLNKTYAFEATVLNVASKNDITVEFNGTLVPAANFTFNNNKVSYTGSLIPGKNTIKVTGKNNDGTNFDTSEVTQFSVNVGGDIKLPCKESEYPIINYNFPTTTVTSVSYSDFKVDGALVNIDNINQITVYLNGVKKTDFSYNSQFNRFSHSMTLKPGVNTYKITLENDCKTIESVLTINYNAPKCGVEFEAFKSSEFCLVTASGTFNMSNLLANSNLAYNGPATSLYFKAKENGYVLINNVETAIVKDNFYSFSGIFTVDLKRVNNKWTICVQSARKPVFGKGATKPANPCIVNKPINNKKPVVAPSKQPKEPVIVPADAPIKEGTRKTLPDIKPNETQPDRGTGRR